MFLLLTDAILNSLREPWCSGNASKFGAGGPGFNSHRTPSTFHTFDTALNVVSNTTWNGKAPLVSTTFETGLKWFQGPEHSSLWDQYIDKENPSDAIGVSVDLANFS